MKTEPLRVFLLEQGDRFIYQGEERRVEEIRKGVLTYSTFCNERFQNKSTIGAHSHERVTLIVEKVI